MILEFTNFLIIAAIIIVLIKLILATKSKRSEKIALFYFIATNIVLLAFANMVQEIEAIFDITILLLLTIFIFIIFKPLSK